MTEGLLFDSLLDVSVDVGVCVRGAGAPQPLEPELVTLSLLPRSQWQTLVHLDAIKVMLHACFPRLPSCHFSNPEPPPHCPSPPPLGLVHIPAVQPGAPCAFCCSTQLCLAIMRTSWSLADCFQEPYNGTTPYVCFPCDIVSQMTSYVVQAKQVQSELKCGYC